MTAPPSPNEQLDDELEHLREHFDHTAPAYNRGLREQTAFMRDTCPVARSDRHGGFWVVSRYEDVVGVLSDHRRLASGDGIAIPPFVLPYPGIPTQSDEPLHAEYRKVLWPYLTPQAVGEYEPFVRASVNQLIDGFIADGKAEIVEALAKPLPARVMTQFFRFDEADGLRCHAWLDDILELGPTDPDGAAASASKLFGFLQGLVDQARSDPRDDVISTIVTSKVDGRPMSNEECVGMVFLTIAGAIETTVGGIAQTVRLLGEHPDQRRRIVEDPSLSASAVEEILRYESPSQCIARKVRSDTAVRDADVLEGEWVLALVGAANFDPARFDDPEAFRVDRNRKDHLAFGHGIHKCQGMHLARLELRVVVEELLRRIPDYEIVGEVETVVRGGSTRGLPRLDIQFPVGGTPPVNASPADPVLT